MATKPVSLDDNPKTKLIRRFIDEKVDEKFLKDHGAQGCGIGQDANGEPCLNLYVNRGRPEVEKIVRPKRIPFHDRETNQDIDIDTREVASVDFQPDKAPPGGPPLHVAGGNGISVGANTGTLGGWAWDKNDHRLVLLSNFHILLGKAGVPIFCPATIIQGAEQHQLGETIQGQRMLDGKPKVDCAIGTVTHPRRAVLEVLELGGAIMATRAARHGDKVVKHGFKTNRTHGRITETDFTGFVGPEVYADCLLIESTNRSKPFADVMDSGSLVLSDNDNDQEVREVIGLHCAHGTAPDGVVKGVACKIENVFRALSITTLPQGVLATIVVSAVGDGANGDHMMSVLKGFRERCATSDVGNRLLDVIDKNRPDLVRLLATSADLRNAAAAMFLSVFNTAEDVDHVMEHPMSFATVAQIRNFGSALAQDAAEFQERLDNADKLRAAIEACLNDLPQAPDSTTLDAIMQPHQPAAHMA